MGLSEFSATDYISDSIGGITEWGIIGEVRSCADLLGSDIGHGSETLVLRNGPVSTICRHWLIAFSLGETSGV